MFVDSRAILLGGELPSAIEIAHLAARVSPDIGKDDSSYAAAVEKAMRLILAAMKVRIDLGRDDERAEPRTPLDDALAEIFPQKRRPARMTALYDALKSMGMEIDGKIRRPSQEDVETLIESMASHGIDRLSLLMILSEHNRISDARRKENNRMRAKKAWEKKKRLAS